MKAVHVKAISLELQKLEENGTAIQKERMCLLLAHHLDVCSRVIEFCLTCDKAVYVYSHSMRDFDKTLIKFFLLSSFNGHLIFSLPADN